MQNLLCFANGDRTFTWDKVRQLSSVSDTDLQVDYTYDDSGIRTSKTVNGVTTQYHTKDGVILAQSDGENTLYFQYDKNGIPFGFIWNGIQYYYVTNQIGDVMGITDTSKKLLVQYAYDAWGAPTGVTVTDSQYYDLAEINPLRYRGYYYDSDTELYYLQSRYYDPSLCRFINSDVLEMSNVTKDTNVGPNMFAYCNNDPVNNDDPTGHFTLVIIAGVAISASSIAALFALFAFATLYATSTTFRNAVNSIINLLIKGVVTGVKTLVSTITLVVKIAKKSRKYKGNEVHHIVAKSDRRAAKSRAILKSNKISVNDKCNLVSVKKTFHKHLHRNIYHSSVYSVLKYANKGTKSKRKARIQGCLVFIGYVLKGAGKLC